MGKNAKQSPTHYTVTGRGSTVMATVEVKGAIVTISAHGKSGPLWMVALPVDTWNEMCKNQWKTYRKIHRKVVRCKVCGKRINIYPNRKNVCRQCDTVYTL